MAKESGVLEFGRGLAFLDSGIARAAATAINDASRHAVTAASKQIREQYNFKSAYLRDRIRITNKASESNLRVVIVSRRRQTRLDRFSPLPSTPKLGRPRRLISVLVALEKGRKILRSAFWVPLKSGKDPGGNRFGLAIRKSVLGKLNLAKELDNSSAEGGSGDRRYEVLHSISVADAFKVSLQTVQPDIDAYLGKRMANRIERALKVSA